MAGAEATAMLAALSAELSSLEGEWARDKEAAYHAHAARAQCEAQRRTIAAVVAERDEISARLSKDQRDGAAHDMLLERSIVQAKMAVESAMAGGGGAGAATSKVVELAPAMIKEPLRR
eukprot:453713-Prymnesium_polylepis.1